MVVIDPAFVPTHAAKPGRTTLVGAGMAIAALLAILLALGLAMLDDRLYDRVDVERLALLPLLSVVPKLNEKSEGKSNKLVKSG
jgi:capsular polysaccharide biosynthesis protein